MNKINSESVKEEVNSYLFGYQAKKIIKEVGDYVKKLKNEGHEEKMTLIKQREIKNNLIKSLKDYVEKYGYTSVAKISGINIGMLRVAINQSHDVRVKKMQEYYNKIEKVIPILIKTKENRIKYKIW